MVAAGYLPGHYRPVIAVMMSITDIKPLSMSLTRGCTTIGTGANMASTGAATTRPLYAIAVMNGTMPIPAIPSTITGRGSITREDHKVVATTVTTTATTAADREINTRDVVMADMATRDAETADTVTRDMETRDVVMADTAIRDAVIRDTATRDMAMADMVIRDAAVKDMEMAGMVIIRK